MGHIIKLARIRYETIEFNQYLFFKQMAMKSVHFLACNMYIIQRYHSQVFTFFPSSYIYPYNTYMTHTQKNLFKDLVKNTDYFFVYLILKFHASKKII